uniref:Uncharacterized protein n=1 Tax=Hordeum vulgare subsp. vulgare TaxID=112509 RepID=A0A8I6Y4U4_HORVV
MEERSSPAISRFFTKSKTTQNYYFFPFLEVISSISMSVSCNSKLEVSLSNVHVCTWAAHVMSIILRRVRCTIRVPGPMGYAHVKGGTALFVGQGSRPCSHKPNQTKRQSTYSINFKVHHLL